MRKLILGLILIASPVFAEGFPGPNVATCAGLTFCDEFYFSPDALNTTATGAISATVTVTCTSVVCTHNTSITFTITEVLADHTFVGVVCAGSGTWHTANQPDVVTASCAGGAVAVGHYLQFEIKGGIPGNDPDGFPESASWSAEVITTANTMLFCPTAGSSCACNGVCGGNTCGSQFSTSLTDTCSCNCASASCIALSVAGPASFTCRDNLDNRSATCNWNLIAGADPTVVYTENYNTLPFCIAPNITTCANTNGGGLGTGSFPVTVQASGLCTPAPAPGTTLSKLSTISTTTASVQGRYSVTVSE